MSKIMALYGIENQNLSIFWVYHSIIYIYDVLASQYLKDYSFFSNQSSQLSKMITNYCSTSQLILMIKQCTLQVKMNQLNFKLMLARIKEDFYSKIITQKRSHLNIEDVAQLLYKYMNGEPVSIRETLMRSTGKSQITWDDLLQFLQEQLSIIQAVKKSEYSPLSATEIIDKHTNQFGKLINYVKTKQTNFIQNMQHVPKQVNGEKTIAICFEKQIVFYDCSHNSILSTLGFKYTHVRSKLMEREQQRKVHNIQNSVKIDMQQSDQIHEIVNINKNKHNYPNSSFGLLQKPGNFLTNNIKNSVRGSQLSSEKSNDRMMFRRNTQSLQRRKLKSNVTKIKNDDVQKVFHFFEHSSIENSINIAHAFVQARNNFQKHIVLQNSFLERDVKQRNFELSSAKFNKNFEKQLRYMKKTNKHLSSVRVSLSQDTKTRHQTEPILPKQSIYDRESSKLRKEQTSDPLQMNSKQLGIISVCFYEQYLLISLFNREIRLFKLKKALNRINQQPIFQKSFKEVVTFVELYRSKNKQIFRIVVGLQKENQSQIIVYHLDDLMNVKQKVFEHEFPYSAKYQSVLPFGVALFNELGYFSLIQLNSSLNSVQQKLYVSTQLINPETNYRISISQVRINSKQTSLFLSCSSGYVFLYDRYTKEIKYKTKVCQSPILDICLFHNDQQLLVLYSNGNMAILSTFHLEKIYLYQSYGQISNQSKIFNGFDDNFYIYTSRTILPYSLTENQQKRFNNIKSAKVLKSRMKLKTKEKKSAQKSKVLKVVQGRGGQQDFLGVILENGQILIFDCNMQYIGSYFYFKVLHIVEIFCNKCHQFLAILLDNNTVEVVNLYTQNLVFTARPTENDPALKSHNRPESSLHNSVTSHKARPPRISGGINLVNFMDEQISNCFLSVISKQGKVSHYNEKGTLLSIINLQDRLGDIVQGVMVYDEEELVLSSDNSLLVLYRKSYNRKCMVKVGKSSIAKLIKCRYKNYSLCVMDVEQNIFLVNTHLKEVKLIREGGNLNKNQHILFNCSLVFRLSQAEASITRLKGNHKIDIFIDHQKYLYSMINENVIQVNKASGKIRKLNLVLEQFQDLLY